MSPRITIGSAPKLTHVQLTNFLDYNPITGVFIWKVRPSNRVQVGDAAGNISVYGYVEIRIDGILYKAHRLAWFYVYKEWPKNEIDHINGDRSDNSITNLRDVSHSVNQRNLAIPKNNTSGCRGVNWCQNTATWRTRIKVNGDTIELGHFYCYNKAVEVRREAEEKYGFTVRTK